MILLVIAICISYSCFNQSIGTAVREMYISLPGNIKLKSIYIYGGNSEKVIVNNDTL
ncbi:MAG: hypothetical protein HOP11_06580 [Saprospiraceae bacterium]|nr:hypothetical protein [Saprospiraceae bacterium]